MPVRAFFPGFQGRGMGHRPFLRLRYAVKMTKTSFVVQLARLSDAAQGTARKRRFHGRTATSNAAPHDCHAFRRWRSAGILRATIAMVFFAFRTPTQEQGFAAPSLDCRRSGSASSTFNANRARPPRTSDAVSMQLVVARAARKGTSNDKANVGGREPPGRNTGRYS